MFFRRKRKSLADEAEEFANMVGNAKYAGDQLINLAISGNDDMIHLAYNNLDDEMKGVIFFYYLGMLGKIYGDGENCDCEACEYEWESEEDDGYE